MSRGLESSNPLDLTLQTGWGHGFALPLPPMDAAGVEAWRWSELTSPSRPPLPARLRGGGPRGCVLTSTALDTQQAAGSSSGGCAWRLGTEATDLA